MRRVGLQGHPIYDKKEVIHMLKMALRYTRYALAALAAVGFGRVIN
jgi:hypothetical protein